MELNLREVTRLVVQVRESHPDAEAQLARLISRHFQQQSAHSMTPEQDPTFQLSTSANGYHLRLISEEEATWQYRAYPSMALSLDAQRLVNHARAWPVRRTLPQKEAK